jgi:iron(III) transport system ATP-binding protein
MTHRTIECRGLFLNFGSSVALDDFDLVVEEGSIVSLLGPSGCGKTTALRAIAGFEAPAGGRISIGARTVFGEGVDVPPEKRRVGMVFQEYALFPHMTVADNVGYGVTEEDRSQREAEVLELVGLTGMGHRLPSELSGGEQQRVALARALAPRPDVVLLDEPFSNLDAPQRERMRREVRHILRDAGATAVFVTHDQSEALAIADTVAVMKEGHVVQVGSPLDIYQSPADPWVASFLGESLSVEGIVEAGTVKTELGNFPAPAAADGPVEVMIRPEWITPTPAVNGEATVIDREYYGHDQMLLIELPDGRRIQARLGPKPVLEVGARVDLAFDDAVVFPAS